METTKPTLAPGPGPAARPPGRPTSRGEGADGAGDHEQGHAEEDRRLAADRVGHRAEQQLAAGQPDEEGGQGGLDIAGRGGQGLAIDGMAGRYMSIAKGPMAHSSPSTSANRSIVAVIQILPNPGGVL